MRDLDARVAGCLALRRATLDFLGGRTTPAHWADAANRVDPRAWPAFLKIEACALPLGLALGAHAPLEARRRALLGDARLAGVKRAMAARAQLATLDAISTRAGIALVVLKTAASMAAGGADADLGDLDLLVNPREEGAFARALLAAGYRPGRGPTAYDLPGGLPVDLHVDLHIGPGVAFVAELNTIPLPPFRSLRRLDEVGSAVHLVQHGATQHPLRRGNIRDLSVLAEALERCTPDERHAVRAALARSPHAAAYLAGLDAADALRTGTLTRRMVAPYEIFACWAYAVSLRAASHVDTLFPVNTHRSASHFSGARGTWLSAEALLLGATSPRSFWYSGWLGGRLPRTAAALSYVVRTPYRCVSLAVSAFTAAHARMRYATAWRPMADRITPARP